MGSSSDIFGIIGSWFSAPAFAEEIELAVEVELQAIAKVDVQVIPLTNVLKADSTPEKMYAHAKPKYLVQTGAENTIILFGLSLLAVGAFVARRRKV